MPDISDQSIATMLGLRRETVWRYRTGKATVPRVVKLALMSLVKAGQLDTMPVWGH